MNSNPLLVEALRGSTLESAHCGAVAIVDALASASHNGEPAHVATARGMLAKAGLAADALECGAEGVHCAALAASR